MTFWDQRRVLITGGASFIGSHLTERLVSSGADVRVADDLSSGIMANLAGVRDDIDVMEADLRDRSAAAQAVADREVVFHLAADHGGRGYIDQQQTACSSNFALDQTVFAAALAERCDQVTFASSACVYPIGLQNDIHNTVPLIEEHVGPPYDPDGVYGMAKLAGERTLAAMSAEHGIATASCRYFTVYGPRNPESHGLAAMVARAFVGEDPFEVWGTGHQRRNWTHVDDIVRGTMAAAERLTDGAVNLGASTTRSVLEAAELVLELSGHQAAIRPRPDKPTGPLNRAADGTLAHQLLGFTPEVPFETGLAQMIEWYAETHDREQVRSDLERRLTARTGTEGAAG